MLTFWAILTFQELHKSVNKPTQIPGKNDVSYMNVHVENRSGGVGMRVGPSMILGVLIVPKYGYCFTIGQLSHLGEISVQGPVMKRSPVLYFDRRKLIMYQQLKRYKLSTYFDFN